MIQSTPRRAAVRGVALAFALVGLFGGAAHTFADDAPDAPPAPAASGTAGEAAHEFPWMRDYQAAQERAKAEKKDLLINFTGSDWCGWCIRLDQEVFSKGDFANLAGKNFVFVFLDFPNAPDLQAKVVDTAKRDELRDRYGVQGFPTILLTFADGTPYAKTGYKPGGPEGYLTHLAELHQNGVKARVLADKREKASVDEIKAGLPAIANGGFLTDPAFCWIMDRIPQIDPKGEAGLLQLRESVLQREKLKTMLDELQENNGEFNDWDAALATLKSIKPATLADTPEEGLYLNLAFHSANWLLGKRRFAEAREMATALKSHPKLASEPQAQAALNKFIENVNAAEKGGAADDADDEMDDDVTDEESGE